MNKKMLNWKRPLFYALLPFMILLVFVGVLPSFPPPPSTKPAAEQSVPVDESSEQA